MELLHNASEQPEPITHPTVLPLLLPVLTNSAIAGGTAGVTHFQRQAKMEHMGCDLDHLG